jgi:hypothetical protein
VGFAGLNRKGEWDGNIFERPKANGLAFSASQWHLLMSYFVFLTDAYHLGFLLLQLQPPARGP